MCLRGVGHILLLLRVLSLRVWLCSLLNRHVDFVEMAMAMALTPDISFGGTSVSRLKNSHKQFGSLILAVIFPCFCAKENRQS